METIYLDNASTTFPKPPEVTRAVVDYMTNSGANVNRGCYAAAYSVEERLLETRQLICELFHGPDCRNVIFTKNVTESLNLLLKGYLHPGDHVLVSSMEHNAVMRPLVQMGVAFTRIPCDETGALCLDAMEECLKPNTRAVVMTHASNVCGTVMPLRRAGAFCRAHNLKFFADCAQTAGVLDIDMQAMKLDAVAFTGHKGLLGPQGTGGLVLSGEMARTLPPFLAGGTGSVSHTEQMPEFLPDKFEPGTPNLPGLMGLRAGLLFLQKTGLAAVRQHEMALTERFLRGLAPLEAAGAVRILGCHDTQNRTGVVSIQTPGRDEALTAAALEEHYGILTRVGLHCAPAAHKTLGSYPAGSIRFSFGWFNTPQQIDAALAALQEVCHGPETT
ncbi:aminotransferase class V-fold PLP-dependent enzyme [bacterium]|nr:aminotransferase class V-fold PLP-dependent enzyme [bacterium]